MRSVASRLTGWRAAAMLQAWQAAGRIRALADICRNALAAEWLFRHIACSSSDIPGCRHAAGNPPFSVHPRTPTHIRWASHETNLATPPRDLGLSLSRDFQLREPDIPIDSRGLAGEISVFPAPLRTCCASSCPEQSVFFKIAFFSRS